MDIFEQRKLNLEVGNKVRIYLNHVTCHDVEVREGVVTNPHSHKKKYLE